MARRSTNRNLLNARQARDDEFYTSYMDVARGLAAFPEVFQGKRVLCNCNDGLTSAFTQYFYTHYHSYNLQSLDCLEYNPGGQGKHHYTHGPGDRTVSTRVIDDDGSYKGQTGLALLHQADLVVTNPPFSLFRDYIKLLADNNKEFLVIGNHNALTYKEIFALFMEDRITTHTKCTRPGDFTRPDGSSYTILGNLTWFTSLTLPYNRPALALTKTYNPKDYPKYDNYDAINVNAVRDIPVDYPGVMGVPVTFLNVHCPDQFEILGTQRWFYPKELCVWEDENGEGTTKHKTLIDGKETYGRVFIRHKNPQQPEGV